MEKSFNLLRPPKLIIRRRKHGERRVVFTACGNINLGDLQRIINEIQEEGACLKESQLHSTYNSRHLTIIYKKDETDFELNERQEQYEIKLQEFEAWKTEHVSEIREEISKKRKNISSNIEKWTKKMKHLEHLYDCCECCEI